MSRLNAYKLKDPSGRIYNIKPAADRKANWSVCRANGMACGVFCSTKKEVKKYLSKRENCKAKQINEVE